MAVQETYPHQHLFNISITSYTIKFSDSILNISCGEEKILATLCSFMSCSDTFDTRTHCPNSTSVNVTVLASNALGDGQESEPKMVLLGV